MDKRQTAWFVIALIICAGVLVYGHLYQGPKEVVQPQGGSGKAVGPERKVRSWEGGGTTVTLYEQDLVVANDPPFQGPAQEQILKAKSAHSPETVLGRYESGQNYGRTVEDVSISPLGTYVTAEVLGYESRSTEIYIASTGELIIEGSVKTPYWTSDEKKVALIQADASIDGTPAAFYYSNTGDLKNTILLKEFAAADYTLRRVVQKGNLLTITVATNGDEPPREENYLLNLQTGALTVSTPPRGS